MADTFENLPGDWRSEDQRLLRAANARIGETQIHLGNAFGRWLGGVD